MKTLRFAILYALCVLAAPLISAAQEWSQPVRGSWVRPDGETATGDIILANNGAGCEIVVADNEHSAVKQAARFLAGDIGKISGYTPAIVSRPTGQRTAIRLFTLNDAAV